MSTDVIMPQMGESIAEGTVTKWLKKIGDPIKRDEPLFEISTDKVDAEIPAPAAGVLLEIVVPEGKTVPINTIVARIGEKSEAPAKKAPEKPAPEEKKPAPPETPQPSPAVKPAAPAATTGRPGGDGGRGGTGDEVLAERRRTKSSPLVRKIASEHGVDISLLEGSGIGGRVTKRDILGYVGAQTETAPAAAPKAPTVQAAVPAAPPPVTFRPGERVAREPMSVMRKKIAEHMIRSRRTSAHVHTWYEADMTNVVRKREAMKAEFARDGVKLTFLPFIMEAVIKGLKAWPKLNASIENDDTIVYHKDINIGTAVALDWGLIVPVVKGADQMNILGLARTINDLAERARTKRLNPEEVQGGTFTITNPGVFGSLMGAPIINQPQVAILGVGAIKKRPVVIDDAIAIRAMVYLSLSFDHRLVDGADSDQFLSHVVGELEKA